jgi:hypothetical protein
MADGREVLRILAQRDQEIAELRATIARLQAVARTEHTRAELAAASARTAWTRAVWITGRKEGQT